MTKRRTKILRDNYEGVAKAVTTEIEVDTMAEGDSFGQAALPEAF